MSDSDKPVKIIFLRSSLGSKYLARFDVATEREETKVIDFGFFSAVDSLVSPDFSAVVRLIPVYELQEIKPAI